MEIVNSIEEINELKNKNSILLIYFASSSCGVCIAMMPKLEEMLRKYPDIKGVKVQAESSPELAANYSVFTAPVIILYVQGKETIREARIISLTDLEEKIMRYKELLHGSN